MLLRSFHWIRTVANKLYLCQASPTGGAERINLFYVVSALVTHIRVLWRRKEGNVLFNDALNTFYLRLYGIRYMVKDHSDRREETCCRHIGYSFRLAARVLLYASSHRQDMYYEERPATSFRHMLVESSCPDKVESTIFGRL